MTFTIFDKLAISNKPCFENVVSLEGTANAAHEEETLYMIQLAKLTCLVANLPEAEYAREVIEFVANMQLDDENDIDSRVTVSHLVHGEKYIDVVRELYIISKNLNAVYELNDRGEDPTLYMMGREREYLDGIVESSVKLEATLNKKYLKPKYRVLLDIVSKCMSGTGSLEQISRPKLRLMAAIEDSPSKASNWLQYLIKVVSSQADHVEKDKDSTIVIRKRILHATKIAFILETCREEEDIFAYSKAFPTAKIIFRSIKKEMKGKKDKPVESHDVGPGANESNTCMGGNTRVQ